MARTVNIGCHSAMWGDSSLSAPQLLKSGEIQYLVGDYLAEVTMAIMAKAFMKSKGKYGYATDFVGMVVRNIKDIKGKGVKIVVNAGGVNPRGCKDALVAALEKVGVTLKIGVVEGDNLRDKMASFADVKEMYSNESFPKNAATCNAYLGAFPIAAALAEGCDIVITGRVVDSALVLGPLIHEFGWKSSEYNKLASGTLAGHLVECGAQGTGGLFTDYQKVEWTNIGYPIIKVYSSGDFLLTKPKGTDGYVCPASATEQMLYEIGDPGAYHVPDVACDFTQVTITQKDPETVLVSNCLGQAPTSTYKVCATYPDGYSMAPVLIIQGRDAVLKAQKTADALFKRFTFILKAAKLPPLTATRVELIGGGGTRYHQPEIAKETREIVLRMSFSHPDIKAMNLIRREISCAGVSMAQGTIGLQGGLAAPSAVVKCFSFLIDKEKCTPMITVDGVTKPVPVDCKGGFPGSASLRVQGLSTQGGGKAVMTTMTLDHLCHGRSGDKGDIANIGIIARKPEYLGFLRRVLTPERVKAHFAHNCKGHVERFDLPGSNSMNFLLHNTLGGGGTSSLHSDPLAKTYASQLLSMEISAPLAWRLPEYSKL
eukprot:TRINITY_DN8375_c0_g1_i1.p1 TRINITY_DN8375_c0_g1~~TRINITY_DN8375_c0_g1_i1.p1  ORF type:complete len:598 (+),score=200.83 TRINITY_DN8375_c0_g1_i1:519-2312(+)